MEDGWGAAVGPAEAAELAASLMDAEAEEAAELSIELAELLDEAMVAEEEMAEEDVLVPGYRQT